MEPPNTSTQEAAVVNPSLATEQFGEAVTSKSSIGATLAAGHLAASQPYVGRWNKLISTTNWEKGRIIQQWRETLLASDTAAAASSDETWSVLVGGVTGQHVGRLRRVFTRFEATQAKFPGLFWSHFQAAVDWDDAEMWLEGAVQSGWSVSRMRHQRWETLGRVEADRPNEGQIVASEGEEDYVAPEALAAEATAKSSLPAAITGKLDEVQGPRHDGPDFGDDEGSARSGSSEGFDGESNGGYADEGKEHSVKTPVELIQPFASLPELPPDVADVFENFKLVLLQHKTAGWKEISSDAMLATLDSLKSLCTAPGNA